MLEKLLSKEDCAACRFCCSFRRQSLWETPLIDKANLASIKEKYQDAKFIDVSENYVKMDLKDLYHSEDPEEEVPCYFNDGGCRLSEEEKPFECSIWPLRMMKKDGHTVIAYTPTCPVLSKTDPERIKSLVREEIGDRIMEYAALHPDILMEYRDDYIIVDE